MKVALVLDLVRRGKLSRAKAAEQNRSGSVAVGQAPWIVRRQANDRAAVSRLRGQTGPGEAEAIVLTREAQADVVVLDDATARRVAEAEGLKAV